MRKFNNQILKIYIIFISIILLDKVLSLSKMIFLPTSFLLLAVLCFFLNKNKGDRLKLKEEVFRDIIIIMLGYLVVYLLSGLLFTFVKSPYNHQFMGIIKNIWMSISIIISGEYIRYTLVKFSGPKKRYGIIIAILFIILELNILDITKLSSFEVIFKSICAYYIPIIIQNILATYLCTHFNYKFSLAYLLPLGLMRILLPIYPNLNWFLIAVYSMVLAFIIYLSATNFIEKNIQRLRKSRVYQNQLVRNFPLILLLVFFILFVSGVFSYKNIAILSDSMNPVFKRGDIVIVKKYDSIDIKLYDIIEYIIEDDTIIHRVVAREIDDFGKLVFVTKGDNNEEVDDYYVYEEQIQGIVIFKIPYLGFPTVWLNDFLRE